MWAYKSEGHASNRLMPAKELKLAGKGRGEEKASVWGGFWVVGLAPLNGGDLGLGPGSLDSASVWQLLFQDSATPVLEGIVEFHHSLMVLVIFITAFVLYMILGILWLWQHAFVLSGPISFVLPPLNRVSHNTNLEVAWTVIPAALLVGVAVPSFALLYSLESAALPNVTTKVVGHQWYWTYEYSPTPPESIQMQSWWEDQLSFFSRYHPKEMHRLDEYFELYGSEWPSMSGSTYLQDLLGGAIPGKRMAVDLGRYGWD